MSNNHRILIIGSGPSAIGNENEADGAAFQIISQLKRHGFHVVLVDDNAFSVTLTQLSAKEVIVKPINYQNIDRAIQTVRPRFLLPILGGPRAMKITQRLWNSGALNKYQVHILGISIPALQTSAQPLRLVQVIRQSHEKPVPSQIISSV